MTGRKQICLPGHLYHIVQRGNNRQACFIETETGSSTSSSGKCIKRYGVDVPSCCVMTNHVYFPGTPKRKNSLSETLDVGPSHVENTSREAVLAEPFPGAVTQGINLL
jgi:putative transposase